MDSPPITPTSSPKNSTLPTNCVEKATIWKKISKFTLPIIQKILHIIKKIFDSKLLRFIGNISIGGILVYGAIISISILNIPLFGIAIPAFSCLIFLAAAVFFIFARSQQTGERKDYFYAEFQQLHNKFRLYKRNLSSEEIKNSLEKTKTLRNIKADYYSPVCYLSDKEIPKKILMQSAIPTKEDGHIKALKDHGVTLVISLTKKDEHKENIWSHPIQTGDWGKQ